MDIVGIISGVTALIGAITTAVITFIKYRNANIKKEEAEQKEFYLYTAYNLVKEAEKMFGDGHGTEKKQYAMTRIQNEALSSGIKWNLKIASVCIEQAVALRNDYKGTEAPIEEIVKLEVEEATKEVEEIKEELKESVKGVIEQGEQVIKIVEDN